MYWSGDPDARADYLSRALLKPWVELLASERDAKVASYGYLQSQYQNIVASSANVVPALLIIQPADLTAVSNWQSLKRQQPLTPGLKLTMAFNGLGTTSAYDFSPVG